MVDDVDDTDVTDPGDVNDGGMVEDEDNVLDVGDADVPDAV